MLSSNRFRLGSTRTGSAQGLAVVLFITLAGCSSPRTPMSRSVTSYEPEESKEGTLAHMLVRSDHPTSLCVDESNVYWTDWNPWTSGTTGVWRIAKNGKGQPKQLVDGLEGLEPKLRALYSCLLQGDELWFTSSEGVIAVPTNGGPPRKVSSQKYGSMVRGPDAVYLGNEDGLFRIGSDGTTSIAHSSIGHLIGGDKIIYTEREGTSIWVGTEKESLEIAVGARVLSMSRMGNALYVVTWEREHPEMRVVHLDSVSKVLLRILEGKDLGWPLFGEADGLWWVRGTDVFHFHEGHDAGKLYARTLWREKKRSADTVHSLVAE